MGPLCSTTLPVQNLFATILMVDFGKLEKRIKKKSAKMKGNNTFAKFFFVNFQGNLENGSGTMWRYVALFFWILEN